MTEEPGMLQSTGSQRFRYDLATEQLQLIPPAEFSIFLSTLIGFFSLIYITLQHYIF